MLYMDVGAIFQSVEFKLEHQKSGVMDDDDFFLLSNDIPPTLYGDPADLEESDSEEDMHVVGKCTQSSLRLGTTWLPSYSLKHLCKF